MSLDTHANDDFSKALVYRARVPLSWRQGAESLASNVIEQNEKCLRTVLALSEFHGSEPGEELAALEHKVDIALDMVASLLRASLDMPAEVEIRLGAHELSWAAGDAPPEGEAIMVTLFLHDLYPKPLLLPARVLGKTASSCTVSLEHQSEELQQLLEKFIFLHHRREIAHRKSS